MSDDPESSPATQKPAIHRLVDEAERQRKALIEAVRLDQCDPIVKRARREKSPRSEASHDGLGVRPLGTRGVGIKWGRVASLLQEFGTDRASGKIELLASEAREEAQVDEEFQLIEALLEAHEALVTDTEACLRSPRPGGIAPEAVTFHCRTIVLIRERLKCIADKTEGDDEFAALTPLDRLRWIANHAMLLYKHFPSAARRFQAEVRWLCNLRDQKRHTVTGDFEVDPEVMQMRKVVDACEKSCLRFWDTANELVYRVLQCLPQTAVKLRILCRVNDHWWRQEKYNWEPVESELRVIESAAVDAQHSATTRLSVPQREISALNESVSHPLAPEQTTRQPFNGGEMVFFPDRVELCGVDICSGPRSRSRRVVLELLAQKGPDGQFIAYCGDELQAKAGENGANGTASGWIRDLRDGIRATLLDWASISSERKDVILSGASGYRLADCVSVQFGVRTLITDITDTETGSDVRDVRDLDVRDVRDLDVRDVQAEHRRAWILQQLAIGARLKAPDVAGHFKRSTKTAQRDFDALRDEGKVEFVGDARTGFYQLCKPPKPAK